MIEARENMRIPRRGTAVRDYIEGLAENIATLTAERDALGEALAEARLQIELLEHAAQYPRD